MPKACKTQANKTLETSPTEPTKKKEKERNKIASRPSDVARNNSTIARYARLESRRHHLEIWLWKTVAKASNSSRIRTQGMQNTSQSQIFQSTLVLFDPCLIRVFFFKKIEVFFLKNKGIFFVYMALSFCQHIVIFWIFHVFFSWIVKLVRKIHNSIIQLNLLNPI